MKTSSATMFFSKLPLPALLFFIMLLSGCSGGGTADPFSKRYSSGEINANPMILDGVRLRGVDIAGMRLENVTLSHTTFMSVTGRGVVMKNVVLNNCRFINAVFEGAVLENVTMNGGLITCEDDPYNLDKQTRFSASTLTNLVLDGVSIENAVFEGDNASITLKNAKNIIATHPIFYGKDARLIFDNCFFKHMTITEVSGKSTLTATNCTFRYAFLGESTFARTIFRNNISYGGPEYGPPPQAAHPGARAVRGNRTP